MFSRKIFFAYLCTASFVVSALAQPQSPDIGVVFFNPIIGKLIVCNQDGFCQYLTLKQNIKQKVFQQRGYMNTRPIFSGHDDQDGMEVPLDLIEDEKKDLSRPKREAIWAKIIRYSLARFPNRFR